MEWSAEFALWMHLVFQDAAIGHNSRTAIDNLPNGFSLPGVSPGYLSMTSVV